MSILGRLLDERFFAHRQRSTSLAGQAGVVVAMGLFIYRMYVDHVWSWDLLTVGVTMAVVKVGLMTWYSLTD